MWKFWLVLGFVNLLALPFSSLVSADDGDRNDEDARLEAFFQRYLDDTFQARPFLATRLGDHRFDHLLDDLSAEAREANLQRDKQFLKDLPEKIDQAKLSDDGRIDYDIFARSLERSIWLAENFEPFVEDPRTYGAYITQSVYLLLTQSSLPKEENVKNALARMAEIPRVIETARQTIGRSPRVKVETAILQTQGAIGFYQDEIFQLTEQPKGKGELAEQAARVVEKLEGYLSFLQDEVLPRSTDDWRIGPEKFAKKLELELDAGLSASEVLAEAEAEASRVEREMAVIARQLWSQFEPGKSIPPDDEAGRRDLIHRVLEGIAQDHGSSDTLLADVQATVADLKQFIRDRNILRLSEPDQLRIIEMPEFMRGNAIAYLNSAPPLDPRATSEYAISPPPSDWDADRVESFFQEYNRAMLQILTIHEAYPGHYVQLEYSNRCPSLIRRVLSSGTFAEGWAVYTEQVMLDQGFGDGDPALRLQQLKFYLRTVLNAILDHQMHAGQMTDDEALELLMGRGFQTEGEAVGKLRRSKQSSAQLSTYFVGRTAFYRLRQALQREQGDRFDLGRFHEAVLSHGTLPVKHLGPLVRKSLAEPAP